VCMCVFVARQLLCRHARPLNSASSAFSCCQWLHHMC
jgi:hypothetical protein